jgi:DMSO/TMAO reductase YedYZ molybdopterin-dependent catalytic subunit
MVLRIVFLGLLLSTVVACVTAQPAISPGPSSSREAVGETGVEMGNHPPCVLPPLIMPSTPEKLPGYTELDSSTGLHVTGTMQLIDQTRYRLEVAGKANRSLTLSYDELRCMPRTEARLTLICPGFFEDVATWAGTPLEYILELAQVQTDAIGIRLIGADQYSTSMSLEAARSAGSFLAYEWEGKALPRLHGFPLRAIFPGSEGNQWVKWLVRIEVY